jgi:hypothetical protein
LDLAPDAVAPGLSGRHIGEVAGKDAGCKELPVCKRFLPLGNELFDLFVIHTCQVYYLLPAL